MGKHFPLIVPNGTRNRVARRKDSAPLCVVAGDDPRLTGHVIASLPVRDLAGFFLAAPPELYRYARLRGCEGLIPVTGNDDLTSLAETLAGAARGRPLVGLGVDDMGTDLLDALSRHLPIAFIGAGSLAARHKLRDKWAFHGLCRDLGIAVPEASLYPDKRAIPIAEMLHLLGAPLVIKPTGKAGGEGVVVIGTEADFTTQVLSNRSYEYAPLIVQRYVEGEDVGLSLLALDGQVRHYSIQVARKGCHQFIVQGAYLEAARRIVEATGFSGLANFDAQLTPQGELFLLECNTRSWATISQTTWGGLNFVRATLEAALDLPGTQPRALVSGFAPRVRDWLRDNLWRPWRLLSLNPDQRTLALLRPWISQLTR